MPLQNQCFVKSEEEGQKAAMDDVQFVKQTDVSALQEGARGRRSETERESETGVCLMGGEMRLR